MIDPETKKILSIGVGVSATIAASVGVSFIETLIVSVLGAEQLAGVTLAISVYSIIFVSCLGVVVAVNPILSRTIGTRDELAIRCIAHQGIWVAATMSIAGLMALTISPLVLKYLANSPEELAFSLTYLWGAALGFPAWILYVAFRSILIAIDEVKIAAYTMLASVPVHALLAYALTLGTAYTDPLGVLGAGIDYSLTSYATVAVILIRMARSRSPALANVMTGPFQFKKTEFLGIIRLGLPMAARIVLREGTMPASVFLVAPFGAEGLAAHAVALRIVSLASIPTFGISNALITLAGAALGSNDWLRAKRVTAVAIRLSMSIGFLVCVGVVAFSNLFAHLFLPGENIDVIALVVRLLGISCLFILIDSIQGPVVGSLVALSDAKIPLFIFAWGSWLIGFPLAFALSRTLPYPIEGAWVGLILGSVVATSLLFVRLRSKLHQLQAIQVPKLSGISK